MKKLIKFQPSAKTFFGIAEDKYEEGDYPAAVHYFYQSFLKRRDVDSLVALGETYADMGESELALKYLFMALDRDSDNPDIRESIAECFLDSDDEETAFFYFRHRMSVKNFKHLMEECDRDNSLLPRPSIKVLEKDDTLAITIALKLMQSGDTSYAKDVLLTVKPQSAHFSDACNLLSLTALDSEQPEKALQYAAKSLEKRNNIDARCNMMMAYYVLGETEKAQAQAEKIEASKPKLEERKAIAFAFIKTGDAKRALNHLKVLYDSGAATRDSLVSYALALYSTGESEQARQLMIRAAKIYPEDVTIKVLTQDMAKGRKLGLYPLLPDVRVKLFTGEIEKKLNILKEPARNSSQPLPEGEDFSGDEDFFDDESFKEKIKWLFQTHFSVSQGRAALILGRHKRWHPFLRRQLLDNYLDLPTKKSCLFALLLSNCREKIGLVLDGLYIRLKPRYPEGMDMRFCAAYCLAFSTYAFSDTEFENRLYAAAVKLLKKYQEKQDFVTSEDALAAVIFFAAGHKKISDPLNCAHLFGCEVEKMKNYMDCLGLKTKA